ncbi:hypothetical protein TrST_g11691 [Triparma strigata]|uniref:N-acetyltransferase domain-containing protein n=1 Tax=Triparma strigata TaxID=1606541 RepID=A0A9W7B530_9STRA|nr:hypothetical protein TrST_g11691 [Triparma strigata]
MSSHLERVSNDLLRQWQDSDDADDELLDAQKLRAVALHAASVLPSPLPSPVPGSPITFTHRKPTSLELGYLYKWLHLDELSHPPPNPAPYYSRAVLTGALQHVHETPCSVPCLRSPFHLCTRLLCSYRSDMGDFPVSFVVLKEDGYSIDAIGTYSSFRGTGAAKSLVEYCINLAVERSDEEYYEIDSLISSILFWRKLGFEVVPAREIVKSKLKELEYHRPMRKIIKKK